MNQTFPLTTFGIGQAIKDMFLGARVARVGWNGPNQFLELQIPDENSKMTLPYIYIRTVQGDLVPWLASQTDLLARDWYVADFPKADEALEGNEQALSNFHITDSDEASA